MFGLISFSFFPIWRLFIVVFLTWNNKNWIDEWYAIHVKDIIEVFGVFSTPIFPFKGLLSLFFVPEIIRIEQNTPSSTLACSTSKTWLLLLCFWLRHYCHSPPQEWTSGQSLPESSARGSHSTTFGATQSTLPVAWTQLVCQTTHKYDLYPLS